MIARGVECRRRDLLVLLEAQAKIGLVEANSAALGINFNRDSLPDLWRPEVRVRAVWTTARWVVPSTDNTSTTNSVVIDAPCSLAVFTLFTREAMTVPVAGDQLLPNIDDLVSTG